MYELEPQGTVCAVFAESMNVSDVATERESTLRRRIVVAVGVDKQRVDSNGRCTKSSNRNAAPCMSLVWQCMFYRMLF